MLKEKYDKILEQFERYYPYWYKDLVDWWPSGRTSITVKLKDGAMMDYNPYDETVRNVQPNNYKKDIDDLRKDIGYNIKKIMQTRGMSQSDIAQRCGITNAMLSRYIHGNSLPSIDKVHALAAVLDCRVTDILGESYENS